MRFMLVVLLLAASPASANPRSVENILGSCEATLADPASDAGAMCAFYMSGVADVFTSRVLMWPACPQPGTTGRDVIRAFVSWAGRNPQHRNEDVFRAVMLAIGEAYPCR